MVLSPILIHSHQVFAAVPKDNMATGIVTTHTLLIAPLRHGRLYGPLSLAAALKQISVYFKGNENELCSKYGHDKKIWS